MRRRSRPYRRAMAREILRRTGRTVEFRSLGHQRINHALDHQARHNPWGRIAPRLNPDGSPVYFPRAYAADRLTQEIMFGHAPENYSPPPPLPAPEPYGRLEDLHPQTREGTRR